MRLILATAALCALAILAAGPAAAVGVGSAGLSLDASIAGRITSANPLGSSSEALNAAFPLYLTGGTGAGQIDTFYAGVVTIAASGSATLTLQGSLVDQFGNSVSFGHVKAILLVAAAGNANDCQIGPGASTPFAGPWSGTSPLTAVSPGETYLQTKGQGTAAGWAVTSSTDVLKLANSGSGTSVTCDVYIAGTSS